MMAGAAGNYPKFGLVAGCAGHDPRFRPIARPRWLQFTGGKPDRFRHLRPTWGNMLPRLCCCSSTGSLAIALAF